MSKFMLYDLILIHMTHVCWDSDQEQEHATVVLSPWVHGQTWDQYQDQFRKWCIIVIFCLN